ncbi:type II secretion system protein [Methylotenera sp.]|jgi:type II secretory pathway pseudopilin PulG|uniref:type II secretion system protein n=1 Tax=Methylotenera sp. TaxID=2051956 RepID=UPI0027190E07|nr:type II secretion system protein [Methylotenera sp.]MDO9204196.1 type II secretion system protein [Methylotenera sp.]MDO9394881.1 type II secretion system protein [Methylotenera sp.]MDP1523568.1 type II secretion system protein [Methylotenera sp.]MDP1659117.1 type II secretion system protein [Methylotenera sp.]MDP2070508.1 type II secretion system protein [Methylotenera sp.]
MFKQRGITSLELLCSLTIISSVTAYTVNMADEVEIAIANYQQTTDLQQIKARIQTAKYADDK